MWSSKSEVLVVVGAVTVNIIVVVSDKGVSGTGRLLVFLRYDTKI